MTSLVWASAFAVGAFLVSSVSAEAQATRHGIVFGNAPSVNGIRINTRDTGLVAVRGINITLGTPHGTPTGRVSGIALGVLGTGAGTLHGIGMSLFAFSVADSATGITLSGLGVGGNGHMRGITVGGLGVGTKGGSDGITVAGLGIGSSGPVRGINLAGLGIGGDGPVSGFTVAGLGIGSQAGITGITLGGLGVGTSGDIRGITIAGLGVGASGSIHGLTMAGIGVGAGAALTGITMAGIAVGAPRIRGLTMATIVGSNDAAGIMLAPAIFAVGEGGHMRGLAVSTYNSIRGEQHGLTIGLINRADELHGVQVGVINLARNNPRGLRVLPGINVHLP